MPLVVICGGVPIVLLSLIQIYVTCILNMYIMSWISSQIKGSGGLLNKITFTGEDVDFLLKRQRALEVSANKEPLTSLENGLVLIVGQISA